MKSVKKQVMRVISGKIKQVQKDYENELKDLDTKFKSDLVNLTIDHKDRKDMLLYKHVNSIISKIL